MMLVLTMDTIVGSFNTGAANDTYGEIQVHETVYKAAKRGA